MFYDQSKYDIRCEWGLSGVHLVGTAADVLIIVDVLSFSTCVDVAVSRGAIIFPYHWKDDRASAYADQLGAELAGSRGQTGKYSLSPESLLSAIAGAKIVLPSPNGSELTAEAKTLGRTVIAGCFRNCEAVAHYAVSQGKSIAVIACGERWENGTLRPAVEDFAAAGAIIADLPGKASPEALAALGVWSAVKNDLANFLASCASGRELIERGFETDVRLAGEINASGTVPILYEQAYVQSGTRQSP